MLKIAFSFWEKEKYIHQHLLTSLISCRPKLLCRNLQTQILGGESRLESRRLLSYQYIYADITFMWVEHWDWKITVWVDIILNLSCDNFWYLDFVNNKWERRNKPGVSTDKGVQAEGSWGDLRQENANNEVSTSESSSKIYNINNDENEEPGNDESENISCHICENEIQNNLSKRFSFIQIFQGKLPYKYRPRYKITFQKFWKLFKDTPPFILCISV